MTQTPRTPFNGYINIPEDEKFNPNRPTLDAICRGNRTMGNILNYFSHRAGLEAERQKLGKDCKVVTISVDREKVLQDLDISEKTYIMYMKRFRALKYILSQRYSRHYDVSFEAINEAIASPPAPTRLGRPPKTESCTHSSQESTSTFKEKGSTYVQELEGKVEVLSEKLKVLDERWKVLELSEKRLAEKWKVLELSESRLATLEQAFSTVFGDPKNYKNFVELEEEGVDAIASHPSPSFSETHSQLPIASRHYETSEAESVTQVSDERDVRSTHGYEKGVRDESGADSIWDRDAGGSGRDTALHPAPDQHCIGDPQEQAIQAAQEVTQQTPLSQGLAPALDGDARESSAPPVATALLLSHTSYYDIDVFAEDTWVVLPGRATEAISGEVRVSADTSLSDATNQPTETAPMKPVSQNKTVQTGRNKKTRGTSETHPETLLESPLVEPDMHGIWNHEKVIQYTEWCLGERYRDTERTRQLNAAKAIHKDDFKLTLEDYKDAYDERNDEWWHEVKGQLHVSHMRGKEKDSGIDRLHAMLGKIAARKAKGSGKPSSSSSAPLGGMYKDKTAELAAERKKYLPPSSEAVTPRIVASATTFSYTR